MGHRGNILMLNIEIECMTPDLDGTRMVRILIGGVDMFSVRVFDTNPDGKRTVEWARYNALRVLSDRMKGVLEHE